MKIKMHQWINSLSLFISAILIIGVDQLSKYVYLNFFIPEKYDNLLTPSKFVNVLWLCLAVGLTFFCTFQWDWFGESNSSGKMASAISPFFGIACISNAGWVILLHNNLIYSATAICLIQIAMLIAVSIKAQKMKNENGWTKAFSILFDIWLAWVIFTFFLMFNSLLITSWEASSLVVSVVAIMIITIIGSIMANGHLVGAMTLVWSLSGVFTKQMQYFVGDNKVIAVCTIIGIFIIGAAAVYFSSPKWLEDYDLYCDNCTFDDVR